MIGGRLITLRCVHCYRPAEPVAVEGVEARRRALKADGWRCCVSYVECPGCLDDEVTAVDLEAPRRARESLTLEGALRGSLDAIAESRTAVDFGRMVLRGGSGSSGVRRVST